MSNKAKGHLFILSAPAGTGKTTLAKMLCEGLENVQQSISCTTRAPRKGEIDGKDYIFFSKQVFEEKLKEDAFIEHANVFGEYYGTLKQSVESSLNEGKNLILVIDTQGALSLKGKIDATFIFISPPSMEELERRLRNRKTDSEESIRVRLAWSKKEMEKAKRYDYIVINEDLQKAFEELKQIFIKHMGTSK